ncbi:uncharacterized protein LOC110029794 [Phalaenopsis equestris]|uniref:uncharacterized protein LOC110029794 n=1 Tax=Phalaenopsis equestris TaxID=78828 RepID=UPI0009E5FC7B|nr:uncharacterized protein LOC110029794 [Phalaenopsis equestris]
MVVALGPGKFYGSSLPRPRFFSDVKLNDVRVDPPVPVMDPLLSWANEAHWSMGGLSFQRNRLQGRIEGSIKKLRVQQDRTRRKKAGDKIRSFGVKPSSLKSLDSEQTKSSEEVAPVTPSPPPKKKRARKLMDEFEKVAVEEKSKSVRSEEMDSVSPEKMENREVEISVSSRTRSRRWPAGQKGSAGGSAAGAIVRRISPRKLLT